MLELSYLDYNDQLIDLNSEMVVPDILELTPYFKETAVDCITNSKYELFAVLLLDPTKCLQYAAVKKRNADGKCRWYLFEPNDHSEISEDQIFSKYVPTALFYRPSNFP